MIDDFQNHAVVQQRDQWCWAACVQMLMSQQLGRRVSQEKIVRDTIGSAADMPVTADLIERAMAATTASGGRASSMRAAFIEGPPSPAGLMEDLQAGRPRIIAVGTGDASGREHVVICYGAEFIDIGDRLVLRRIHIFDPAPNAGGFRIVEASELRGGASMSSWAGSSGGARSPHVTGTFRVVTVRG